MDNRTLARFMTNVRILDNGCWYWTGTVTKDGYGQFSIGGTNKLAHRVSFEHFREPIPGDLELDHLCHTRDRACPGGKRDPHRRCVNWADLEPVTGYENTMRGCTIPAVNAAKVKCVNGHDYTPENTYIDPQGRRECRICRAERARQWVTEHHPGVRHGTETHCPSNHPYSGDNLIITVNGGRACRECKRDWNREYMRAKRAAAKAAKAKV
jgi:hypothetical protein